MVSEVNNRTYVSRNFNASNFVPALPGYKMKLNKLLWEEDSHNLGNIAPLKYKCALSHDQIPVWKIKCNQKHVDGYTCYMVTSLKQSRSAHIQKLFHYNNVAQNTFLQQMSDIIVYGDRRKQNTSNSVEEDNHR